jgi:RNA polymerase sigma-70 factor (ECF subfamily)
MSAAELSSLARSVDEPGLFEDFYRAHAEPMLAYFVRRTFDPHIALDLSAETFAIAFTQRAKFRGRSDAEAAGWLYQIAKNALLKYQRTGQVRQRALQRLKITVPAYSEGDLARVDELRELETLREEIADHFDALPPRLRDAVSLRIVDELSYADVAVRLGVSEQTARARVSRALRKLRASLAPLAKERTT